MLLDVIDLYVHFRNGNRLIKAVDGINLSINQNEIVGLVGESGSGKSTVAFSIMGLLPKNSFVKGKIQFLQKDILRLNEKELSYIRGLQISMIFQEPFTSLNPVLKIGEQIGESITAHKMVKKRELRETVLGLLKKVKIKNPVRIYESYPHLLSGGERQRVMIAMAISMRPSLLIADEPTTALDVTTQKDLLELLLDLKQELGMSILFITHNFSIINKMADKVVIMKDGKIVEEGEKRHILQRPRHYYTKLLIEAVPRVTGLRHTQGPSEGNTVIELINVFKSFPVEQGFFKKEVGKIEAVKNVSFRIEEGKTFGIVGESGCGKTTLAKLLIGLLQPDSGEIKTSIDKSYMQIVFQDPFDSLDPMMRMQDIVLEGLTIKRESKPYKERTIKKLLPRLKLEYSDRLRYPHQFSGGQRQRIAIARALAVNPKVLILDEPVSSLDIITQKGILNMLKELQKELSLTYIFISHDLRIVEYMSDYVAVMYKGEIVELGSAERVYNLPSHPYTKTLLSSILPFE